MMKMKRKLITTVVAASVLSGTVSGVVMFGSGSALAAGRSNSLASRDITASHDRSDGLNQLLKNGTITQGQIDAIQAAMLARMRTVGSSEYMSRLGLSKTQNLQFMSGVLSDLVKRGTITQEQATAISGVVTVRNMMDFGGANRLNDRGYGTMGHRSGSTFDRQDYGMMGGNYGSATTSGGYGMMGGF